MRRQDSQLKTHYFLPRQCLVSSDNEHKIPVLDGIPDYTVFFLLAIAPLRGPLRVRALVLVRWPRTGRPRRCRSPRKQPISISRLMFIEISLRRSPSTPPCSSITRLIFRTSSSPRSLTRT